MPSTSTKKPPNLVTNEKGFCSVFGIKASIIIVGFIQFVAILVLLYFSTWTIVIKHKYAFLTSAYLYTTSTYLLLFAATITSIAVIILFITAWIEHGKGLKIVRKSIDFSHDCSNEFLFYLDTCYINLDISY